MSAKFVVFIGFSLTIYNFLNSAQINVCVVEKLIVLRSLKFDPIEMELKKSILFCKSAENRKISFDKNEKKTLAAKLNSSIRFKMIEYRFHLRQSPSLGPLERINKMIFSQTSRFNHRRVKYQYFLATINSSDPKWFEIRSNCAQMFHFESNTRRDFPYVTFSRVF